MTYLFLFLLADLLLVVAGVAIYNALVRLRVRADNAWADIDVQLKRRHDLIPNLVESVKGYASHERETLEAVTAARTRAQSAATPGARAEAEAGLSKALVSLFALAEAYPQLQAADGFRDLQAGLEKVEDAIQNARRYYNAVVRDFNTRQQTFPSNLVAQMAGFEPREFFAAAEGETAVPQVRF